MEFTTDGSPVTMTPVVQRRAFNFQDIMRFLWVDRNFYEPLYLHQSTTELVDVSDSVLPPSWRVFRSQIWNMVLPPIHIPRMQGWKIHISAVPKNAEAILREVLQVCLHHGVAMKFVCDKRMLTLINSRNWDRGSSGKFITVYPHNDDQFHAIIDALYNRLRNFEGPYILSDKRYRDCRVLYYRYGGFSHLQGPSVEGKSPALIVAPDGQEMPDLRLPYFAPPFWVQDPFLDESEDDEDHDEDAPLLKSGRYIIHDALAFSNAGGVYRAFDSETGSEVVIKEARPFTDSDTYGNDAVTLRQKELRLLSKLHQTGLVPEALDAFWEWEHYYLVETYLEGESLRNFPAARSVLLKTKPSIDEIHTWIHEILTLCIRLTEAMHAFHQQGIIIGDVSPNNIIYDPETLTLKFIDLEGAYESGIDKTALVVTPGFTSRSRGSHLYPTFADDLYSLGCLMLWLIWPITTVLDINPGIARTLLAEVQADYRVPDQLVSTVASLLSENEDARPQLDTILRVLQETRPDPQLPISRALIAPCELESLLPDIIDFILSTSTPYRRDRLFPADPAMTNPLGIAHGAVGVAYALSILCEMVPREVYDWILARDLLPEHYSPGLYEGLSGIAWGLAEIGCLAQSINVMRMAQYHPCLFECPDLYYGTAGYGLSSLYFWIKTGEQCFLDQAVKAADWIACSAVESESGYFWPDREGATSVGYARGSAGVSLFLLYLYCATNEERFLTVGMKALEFDLDQAAEIEDGVISFPEDTTNTSNIVMPYWLSGSAGVGTSLLRYAVVTQDKRFVSLLPTIASDTCRKYTVFPGLFHGLSGLGNFLIDCYQLMGEEQYLLAAHNAARGVLLHRIAKCTGVAFPGDNGYRISADFGTGCAGIALFLHRLLHGGGNFNFVLDSLLRPKSTIAGSSALGPIPY